MRIQAYKKTYKQMIAILIAMTILVIGFVLGFSEVVHAQFNEEINYQAKLRDSSGATVADGSYDITFRLYTVSSGGTAIWTETRSSGGGNAVSVQSGLFSVLLGDVSSLSGVDFNQELWLGIEVEGDGEMSPRKKLASVPSAFQSGELDGLDSTQFLRSDDADTLQANSASTLLSIDQTGSGDILNILSGGSEILTVLNNGNVGIGTDAPSSTLSVSGDIDFDSSTITYGLSTRNIVPDNSSNAWLIATSSSALPMFTVDTRNGSSSVSIGTLSADVVIGKSGSPSNIVFDTADTYINWNGVSGESGYGLRDNSGTIEFKNSGDSWTSFDTVNSTTSPAGSDGAIQFNSSGSFGADVSNFFWDDTNNRLGIGTTTPAAQVDITALSATNPALILEGASSQSANYFEVNTNGTSSGDLFAIDSSGNVDIGSATAGGKLLTLYTPGGTGVDLAAEVAPGGSAGEYVIRVPMLRMTNGRMDFDPKDGKAEVRITGVGTELNFYNTDSDTYYLSANSTRFFTPADLGVGDDSPDHTLDVDGNIGMTAGGYLNWADTTGSTGYGIRDNAGNLEFKDSGGTWTDFGSGSGSSSPAGSDGAIQFNSSGSFGADVSNFFWDDTNDRLGIGTSTPDTSLVIDNSGSVDALKIYSNSDHVELYESDSSNKAWKLSVNNSNFNITEAGVSIPFTIEPGAGFNAFYIDSNSNVGIGTTSPLAKLDVNGSAILSGSDRYLNFGSTAGSSGYGIRDNAGSIEFKNDSGSWASIGSGGGGSPGGSDGEIQYNDGGSFGGATGITYDDTSFTTSVDNIELGASLFETNAGVISWIDMPVTSGASSGVEQSYSAQIDGNSLLTVYGESDGSGGIQNSGVGINTTDPLYKLHVETTGTGSVAGFTNDNGTCTIDPTTTSLVCSSDATLKTDVQTLSSTSTLSSLTKLQGVTYRWNGETGGERRYGFLAQDVQEIFPEFVSSGPDGKLAISYGSFTPVMVEAIKDLNVRISELENTNSTSTDDATDDSDQETDGGSLTEITFGAVLEGFESIGVTFKEGLARIKKLFVREIIVEIPEEGEDSIAGVGQILPNEKRVIVENEFVRSGSKVFITFTSDLNSSTWFLEKDEGEFSVELSATSTATTTFDYLVVQIEEEEDSDDTTDDSYESGTTSDETLEEKQEGATSTDETESDDSDVGTSTDEMGTSTDSTSSPQADETATSTEETASSTEEIDETSTTTDPTASTTDSTSSTSSPQASSTQDITTGSSTDTTTNATATESIDPQQNESATSTDETASTTDENI